MVVVVVVGVRDVVTDTVTLSTYIVRCITLHCKCVLNCAVPVLVPYCTRVHLGTIFQNHTPSPVLYSMSPTHYRYTTEGEASAVLG